MNFLPFLAVPCLRCTLAIACRLALAMAAVIVVQSAGAAPAAEPELERLLEQLNADSYIARQQAERGLLELGPEILPRLEGALESERAEVRFRVRRIFNALHHRELTAGFLELGSADDAEFDLERGMWLVARVLDIDVSQDDLGRRLDTLAAETAAELRKVAGDDFANRATPTEVIDALRRVLHERRGLRGNREAYDLPENSSLWRLLETGKGLPLTLSHAAVAVGERLDLPLVGLSIPGRYMFKYEGNRAPEGQPRDDVIVDPFGDWRVVTPEELQEQMPGFNPAVHLAPCSARAALVRMLTNMENDLRAVRRSELADRVQAYGELLESPEPP